MIPGVPSKFSPRQLARSAMAAALPRSLFMVRGPRGSNRVCLTFDDGPHPVNTPRLLEVLKTHDARATFFVIGRDAQAHPDILRRIVAEGHELGHHTFHHARPSNVSAAQLATELNQTAEVVERATGVRMTLFRPPWGKMTVGKFAAAWRAGLSVVLWNVDPKDCSQPHTDAVLHWFQNRPLHAGDVVLMHDDMPHAEAVIPWLASRSDGRAFVTVSEMFAGRRNIAAPVASVPSSSAVAV